MIGEVLGHGILVPINNRFDQRSVGAGFTFTKFIGPFGGREAPFVFGRNDRRIVLVWSGRVCDAPPRHREFGIAPNGFKVRGNSAIKVVTQHQRHALVKPQASFFRVGLHRPPEIPQLSKDHRWRIQTWHGKRWGFGGNTQREDGFKHRDTVKDSPLHYSWNQ